MGFDFKIKETADINIEGGFVINGFPSTGLTSAIATELMINTSRFEFAATVDSDSFPPVSYTHLTLPTIWSV